MALPGGDADYSVSARTASAFISKPRPKRSSSSNSQTAVSPVTQAFARRIGDGHHEGGAEVQAVLPLGREEGEPGLVELGEEARRRAS